MTSAILIAVVLCQLAISAYGLNNCTIGNIGQAQAQFNTLLKIPQSVNWGTPNDLSVAIQDIFINGVSGKDSTQGLVQVCNAYNAYLKSLADQLVDYKTCLNPRFIIDNDGNNPIIGYSYVGILNQLAYQCGAGFFPAQSQWTCIQNTYATRNTTLLNCLNNMHFDLSANYTATCTYTKAAIECWQREFAQVCGHNNEVDYYACQTAHQYTLAAYGECDDRCIIFERPQFAVDNAALMAKLNQNAPSVRDVIYQEIKAKYMRTEL
uniref:Secreted protein n=1 Tax=Panagrellus redivivus TaxID=6233 RepID=A0A7E4W9Z2_PANRE